MVSIRAAFGTTLRAHEARLQLENEGIPASEMALPAAQQGLAEETSRDGRLVGRIVLLIALASVVGTAIGAAFGIVLHVTVGPKGTSGLILQVASWAIFAHLLIGMWAGYLLLADRTEREIGHALPVILTVRCANIDADAVIVRLRDLGATEIEVARNAPTPSEGDNP